jgi:hypothetical protein
MLAGGASAVMLAATGGPAVASASPRPMLRPPLDTSHATPEMARLATASFRQKQARSVAGWMSLFSNPHTTYTDAVFGGQWRGWSTLKAAIEPLMAQWPADIHTYPLKVIGDIHSGIVFFYNSPQLFGHELRVIAAWDMRDGKIARQVDYWDGRHFTIAGTEQLRAQTTVFPTEFGEHTVPPHVSPILRRVTSHLSRAFASGDAEAAITLFAPDATFEDLTLHSTIVGQQAISGFLDRALPLLPYGPGTSVRHVVGSAQGGGYEWTKPGATVPNGIVALELDAGGLITSLTTVWDGSTVTDATLATMLQATIEH